MPGERHGRSGRVEAASTAVGGEGSPPGNGPCPAAALIEIRRLEKRFPLDEKGVFVQACKDVSFSIAPGETLGLVGESGSGKTTVGRCILRLLEPTSGEVYYSGTRIDKLSMRRMLPSRARLQIVFQEPLESLNPRMSVRRTLNEPLKLHMSLDKAERHARMMELLDHVGLAGRTLDAYPRDLSGGDQQRVAIARALAPEPSFIVLDEPTSSLPQDAQRDILALLRSLQEELALSYLFVSHDLSLVRYFCDRVAVMYLSQIVEMGPLEAVFGQPQHPYSRALLASVLEPRVDAREARVKRRRLEGEIPSPVDLPHGCYLATRCPVAKERCRTEPQTLDPIGDGHLVRCWRVAEADLTDAEWEQGGPALNADENGAAGV